MATSAWWTKSAWWAALAARSPDNAVKPHLRLSVRKTWLPYSERFDVLWCVSIPGWTWYDTGEQVRTTWYASSGDAIRAASHGSWYRERPRMFWLFKG